MQFKRSGRSIIFPLIMSAFGWTVHQGCSNLFGASTCAKAPPALEAWSATSRTVESVRAPNDRANFEAFLTKHPNALNKRYGYGCETPLHSAARLDRGDIAPLLIAGGADLRALDRNGEMPIHTAAKHGNATVVKLLLAAGADANEKGPSDTAPLQYAMVNAGRPADPDRRRAITEALLAAGADVNARQASTGYTPLHDATLREPHDEAMIEMLLKHGADVRAVDHQGEPLLVTAVSSGSVVTVRRLLDRGADVNAASKFCTALASAAGAGNVEVVALLMERGADVNRRIPGSRLIWEGLPLALTLEVFGGIDKERVPRKREAALALIARGADVNARNASGETMLHFVVGEGNMPAIELLLSHGAAVSPPDHAGFTPLHRAVENGHVEAATRLLVAGADTRAATKDGRTPLSIASSDREMAALIRRHAN